MELARCAVEPNPFFEPWYLLPALKAFDAADNVRLLVLQDKGRWLGLLPISRQSHYYGRPLPHLASWTHANCFLGAPLVAKGCEAQFWQVLLDWGDAAGGMALFLHLSQLPLEGRVATALNEQLALRNRTAGVVFAEERALLASDLSPDSYLEASMSGKKRKELRRQHNRLSELGQLAFERRDNDVGLDAWCRDFLYLEQAGWKGEAGSALACSLQTETMFRESLTGAAALGRLERLTLTLDGKPIAMLANFLSPPGSFSYKTAFDEAYSRFSPGVLLQRENLALLNRDGIEWCDSCAASDHPMIDHIWRERRRIGSLSIAIGGAARQALFRLLLTAEMGRRPDGARP